MGEKKKRRKNPGIFGKGGSLGGVVYLFLIRPIRNKETRKQGRKRSLISSSIPTTRKRGVPFEEKG